MVVFGAKRKDVDAIIFKGAKRTVTQWRLTPVAGADSFVEGIKTRQLVMRYIYI